MAAARAYLSGGRVGDELDRLTALRARIARIFGDAGALHVEPETLQPADLLLDLYGEDIRARAFLTQDPIAGELCLRPDFTVPVARLHMEEGRDPARYSYEGLVWRRQAPGANRPTEFLQAGVELLGGEDPAEEDAEVFALIRDALGPLAGDAITGDLGVVFAAIAALDTTEARKSALRRHVWRPHRFQALLERFSKPTSPPPALVGALGAGDDALDALIEGAGKFVGARTADEIKARIRVIAEDVAATPLTPADRAGLEAVLSVRGPAPDAVARLSALNRPALAPAIDRLARRLDALARRGVAVEALLFDAAFGRTLEYYDGFVFEFAAPRPGLPALGGGGRYDALTAILGGGHGSTAVGGIVRPEAMIAAEGEA